MDFLKHSLADMHTHSEFSHDSVCPAEEMLESQRAAGTLIFAVTDHFDTDSYDKYDVFTPIKNSVLKSNRLNESQSDVTVLSGIEISEGFWHPEILKKVMEIADYDVIIGSVHLVKYKNLTSAYSGMDFSALDRKTVCEYLDAYFDDVLTLIDTTDFDILAHLTCPLRYICGKYGIEINLSLYGEKIETVLKKIIGCGTALELNTSSYRQYGIFFPDAEILKKYYDLGGRLVTLGSDAHVSKNASADFSDAVKLLKQIGFENILYYKNRKPYKIDL